MHTPTKTAENNPANLIAYVIEIVSEKPGNSQHPLPLKENDW